MSDNILKTCKKCVVQQIINPGLFLMIECTSGKNFKNEIKNFEELLERHVEKLSNAKDRVSIGQVVAVEGKKGFHRGLITDIYNKKNKNTFEVFLIDYGTVIETDMTRVCLIRDCEIRNKKLGTFEVKLHEVQPVTIDITHLSHGLFQKRVSPRWPEAAFKLVEEEIKRNQTVYVKYINVKDTSVSGEIYLVRKKNMEFISLSEMLCQKGYAVIQPNKKLTQGGCFNSQDIEMKIPETALPEELRKSHFHHTKLKDGAQDKNVPDNSHNQCFSLIETSPNEKQVKLSSSWVLKKVNKSLTLSTSCESLETVPERNNKSPSKVNLLRVAQRNVEMCKQLKEKGNCHY